MKTFVKIIGILLFYSSLANAYEISERNSYDCPKDDIPLYLHKADVDGDQIKETVSFGINDSGTNIYVLKWVNEFPVVVGAIDRLDGIITAITISDIDKDGRDEIILSVAADGNYVYIYGFENGAFVQEYKICCETADFSIVIGLATGDTDNDGNPEIILGLTEANERNLDDTFENMEDVIDYLAQGRYSEAKRLLSSGIIKSPLSSSRIVKLERQGQGFIKSSYPVDDGLIYRLSIANSRIVVDMVDFQYENVNSFLSSIGDILVNEVRRSSFLPSLLFPEKTKAKRAAALNKARKAVSSLESAIISSHPPSLFRPRAVVSGYAHKILNRFLDKDTTTLSPHREEGSVLYYQGCPYYSRDIRQTIDSYKEEPLLSPQMSLPEIPQPLINGSIKILTWNGSSFDKKSKQIGCLSSSTLIAKDKVIVKAMELDYSDIREYLNSLLKNLVRVEIVKQERFVDPYTGQNPTYSDSYIELTGIPLFSEKWLTGKLKAFSFDDTLSPLWTATSTFGPFNPNMYLKDDEVIVATGELDFGKLNTYLSGWNSQWQEYRNMHKINREYDFEFCSPQLPQDIFRARIEAYDLNQGTQKWATDNLGIAISKIEPETDKMYAATIEMNFDKLDEVFTIWQKDVAEYYQKIKVWRNEQFSSFMDELLPQINTFNKWAIQWHDNGCKVDNSGQPVSPQQPVINWISAPDRPYASTTADDKFESNIHEIFCGRLTVFDLSSHASLWSNNRTQLSLCLVQPNPGEVVLGGVDLLPLLYGQSKAPVVSSLYLFREKDTSKGSIAGRVKCKNTLIKGVNITALTGISCAGTNISKKYGNYDIINLPEGSYSVTASMPGCKPTTIENIVVNAGTQTSIGDIEIESQTSLSGRVMVKRLSGDLLPLGSVTINGHAGFDYFSAATRDNGTYQTLPLLPGTYCIYVDKTGFRGIRVENAIIGECSKDFVLFPVGSLKGRIIDETTGKGIANANIVAWNSDDLMGACTDFDGNYTFPLSEGTYKIRVDVTGNPSTYMDNIQVIGGTPTIVNINVECPAITEESTVDLLIYPNPFTIDGVTIKYKLGQAVREVRIKVFNIAGEEVQEFMGLSNAEGTHYFLWNGRNKNGDIIASGIYLVVLETDNCRQIKKVGFVK